MPSSAPRRDRSCAGCGRKGSVDRYQFQKLPWRFLLLWLASIESSLAVSWTPPTNVVPAFAGCFGRPTVTFRILNRRGLETYRCTLIGRSEVGNFGEASPQSRAPPSPR